MITPKEMERRFIFEKNGQKLYLFLDIAKRTYKVDFAENTLFDRKTQESLMLDATSLELLNSAFQFITQEFKDDDFIKQAFEKTLSKINSKKHLVFIEK